MTIILSLVAGDFYVVAFHVLMIVFHINLSKGHCVSNSYLNERSGIFIPVGGKR